MLLITAVLTGIACIQLRHSSVAAASDDTECPPKYPLVQLSHSCAPVAPWCKRLGHGARNWHQCQPRCRAFLQFGERRYRLVSWSDKNKAKVAVFSLALYGWRNRDLTIWRGKVYSRRRGSQGGAWKTVYQVDGRLVAVRAGAKPPFNCGKHLSGGSKSARGQWSQLQGSCHGNKCIVRLSLSQLIRKVALLRHRGGDRGRKHKAELRFILAYEGGRAQLVTNELRLVATHSHREDLLERNEDPSETYRRFLARRREEYWRKKGRNSAGAKKPPRELKTDEKKTRNQQRMNGARSRELRKSKMTQTEDKTLNELEDLLT